MNSKQVDVTDSGKSVHLPKPDPANITVLTPKLPNKPILPWSHFDSPWLEDEEKHEEEHEKEREEELEEELEEQLTSQQEEEAKQIETSPPGDEATQSAVLVPESGVQEDKLPEAEISPLTDTAGKPQILELQTPDSAKEAQQQELSEPQISPLTDEMQPPELPPELPPEQSFDCNDEN